MRGFLRRGYGEARAPRARYFFFCARSHFFPYCFFASFDSKPSSGGALAAPRFGAITCSHQMSDPLDLREGLHIECSGGEEDSSGFLRIPPDS